ncbi:MAG: DUF2971 domain-containing protein [Lachnospiraceae bacterium]|nr:DUF2971 domain-containing protein [Lachnospiraceae bacterium]
MNIKQQYKFNSIMIKSFSPGDELINVNKDETLKYHYTSPEAFLNIIRKKCVYFTDIRYLNDKKEDIYLIELIRTYISRNKGEFKNVEAAFDYLIGESVVAPIKSLEEVKYKYEKVRKFVFCTCTEPDSLAMWNYYVNNGNYQGYNIGFNIEKLLKTFDTSQPKTSDPFEVLYGQVLYNEKKQFEEIERILHDIDVACAFHGIEFAKTNLLLYIDKYSPFFKHSKFEHEKEYRIVIEISDKYLIENGLKGCYGGNNQEIEYDFRTKQGILVPFLKIKYNDDAISRITVSPITEFTIAKESLKELMRVKKYKNVQVWQSNIPIRF